MFFYAKYNENRFTIVYIIGDGEAINLKKLLKIST